MGEGPATLERLRTVLLARLLIAQAGGSGGLGWWEDESLTNAGRFLLARLFPRTPARAGRRVALLTAASRYAAALPASPEVRHLFFLGDTVEAELGSLGVDEVRLPDVIGEAETLRRCLVEAAPAVPDYRVVAGGTSGTVQIELASLEAGPTADDVALRPDGIALALASAACAGSRGVPVFPFLIVTE